MSQAPPSRMPFLARLLLLLVAVAAVAVPCYLYLPDVWLVDGLSCYYSPDQYNLQDPNLLLAWRMIASAVAGVALCILLYFVLALGRRSRRQAVEAALPPALRSLRRAAAKGTEAELVAAVDEAAAALSEDGVDDLLALLRRETLSDEARVAIASALYRIGRAVTAEVELHPHASGFARPGR